MASGLNTKINSYAIEKGIEFDEAYTLTPAQTGTHSALTFSLIGNAPRRVYDSPSGGANTCWEFDWTTSATTNTYYNNATATYRALFSDADYSIGFWFKVPTLPSDTSFYKIFELASTSTAVGFGVDLMGSTSTVGGFTGSKLRVQTNTGSPVTNSYSGAIEAGKWYYFAIRRVGSTGNNFFVYLNGTQFANPASSQTGSAIRITFGRNGSHGANLTYRIANFYSASSSVIGETQIAEIAATGIAGYETAIQNLGTTPYNWYKFNDPSGIDLVPDSGSANQQLNLSSNPTWLTYPNAISKGGISFSAFAGYDTNASTTYGQNNTMAFWFKRSSPPASQLQWSNKFYTSELKWNTASEAGINTNGTIRFAPTLGTAQPALTSTKNICDNQSHYVVITRGRGTNAKMYIDGILESSQTWSGSTIV